MIQPTLGRIVWYTPHQGEPIPTDAHGRCAAIVVKVLSDRLVNLTVFGADGNTWSRTDVQLVQEGDAAPVGGRYCEWMPFQLGQAAKTVQLEKKLAGGA